MDLKNEMNFKSDCDTTIDVISCEKRQKNLFKNLLIEYWTFPCFLVIKKKIAIAIYVQFYVNNGVEVNDQLNNDQRFKLNFYFSIKVLLKNLLNMIGFSEKICILVSLQDATNLIETHPN